MDYVPSFFTLGALRRVYEQPIRPIHLIRTGDKKTNLKPPDSRRPRGAPTKRVPSIGEKRKVVCQRCGGNGHYKTKCTNPAKPAAKKAAAKPDKSETESAKSETKSAKSKTKSAKSATKKPPAKKPAAKKRDTSARRNRLKSKRKRESSTSGSD
eukprot:TRINITY_DN1613_c0_g1_i1.p2 TRINITY_DN1613_c0_g1~~TRINITY_DN1613_c0_g1_i1.p2  ORF type:complete len:154 (-),score=21.49 TRINITY_DN1613_c0_g1_i1:677-1138(-)